MKRKVIIVSICLVGLILIIVGIILGINHYRIKHAKVEIVFKDDLELDVYDTKHVSYFIDNINGKLVDDYIIDSKKIGKKKIDFEYINDDNIRVSSSFVINVVDREAPLIWVSGSYSLPLNSEQDLTDLILCGDNYDKKPKCYIEGDYDSTKVGKYNLTYNAIDKSGNSSKKNFVLNVYDSSKIKVSEKEKVPFSEIVKNYKTNDTKIGLDISKWQQDIDFVKLKEAGVEFVILRVGGTRGSGGEYFIDDNFKKNIIACNKLNIPVGVYFYSYASSVKQAKKDAQWVLKQIKDYNVSLPVSFDWEDWSSFNSYNISFYDLNQIAHSFITEIKKAGYKSMLYSSKNYLEQIWSQNDYDVWLAHYTQKTNYAGKYKFWQLSENGRVDGINTDVDIDIMYNK